MAEPFDILEASKKGLEKFRQFYLGMNHGAAITEERIQDMASLMKPDVSVIYFWGKCSNASQWIEDTKEMIKAVPVDQNAKVIEEDFKVVFVTDTHCMLQAKDIWHIGKARLSCYATMLFAKDDSAPHGISLVHYQETKVETESLGFGESAGCGDSKKEVTEKEEAS